METFQILSASNPDIVDASGGVVNQPRTRLVNYAEFRVGHLVQPLNLAETCLAPL